MKERNSHEDEAAFRAFVISNLDPERYRQINGDVGPAGTDPVEHWLNHGLYEGRSMQSGTLVLRSKSPHQALDPTWRRFVWRGEYIAVRSMPLSPSLRRQILDQARHEPAALPPKTLPIDRLPYAYRPELLNRDGMDVASILAAIKARPKSVVILPDLRVGGTSKYAADLTDVIRMEGGGPVLVLVTDQTAEQAAGWEAFSVLSPFRAINLAFWRDICGRSHSNARFVAILLNFLRPRNIIVTDSSLGLEAVTGYGKGLTQSARLYCTALGSGANEVATVAMKFIRDTLPFALTLTDNEVMAATLRGLYGQLPGPGIAVLPSRLLPASDEVFAARLASRRHRARSAAGHARWAWVSRCEPLKGSAILAILATLRPQDQFEIYGPCDAGLENLGLALPNIVHHGPVHNVASLDLADYDGFVFTSLFEGMPNVVLEMSQHAIPLVLADVGDLRTTFNDSAALFVQHGLNVNDTAAKFDFALDRLALKGVDDIATMAITARNQALVHHAPAVHACAVAQLFHSS